MRLTSQEIQQVPTMHRKGWLVECLIDLLINISEELFNRIINHVQEKRAEQKAAGTQDSDIQI